ncbi:MAG: CHRD domain-containing protein [Luteimonas sp.]
MKSRSLLPAFFAAACMVASGLVRADDLHLHAVLDSTPLVPAPDSTASGEARAILHDDGSLQVNAVFAGLASDVTEVSLHSGPGNATGPAITALNARRTAAGIVVNQRVDLQASAVADVRAGNSYLLVTTTDRPFGALRGQLMPQPARLPAQTP